MKTRKLLGGLLALGLVLAAGSAFGQITGTILGTVSDDQGLVLPGATVSVSSDQLPGGPRSAVTNASVAGSTASRTCLLAITPSRRNSPASVPTSRKGCRFWWEAP